MAAPKLLWAACLLLLGAGLVWASLRRLAGIIRRRRGLLAALRMGVVLCAALLAAGPAWLVWQTAREPGPLLVALDCSDSMDLPDMPGATTRREAMSGSLLAPGALLDRLAADRRVEVYRFADLLLPLAARQLPRGGSTTDLSVALQQLQVEAARSHAAAVLLVSDGVDTEGMTPPYVGRLARGLPPVFAVAVGGCQVMPNRKLLGLRTPRQVRAGESVSVAALVSSATEPAGRVAGQWRTSAGPTGALTALLGSEGMGRAQFAFVAPKPGRHRVLVRLDALAGEISREDNAQAVMVDVVPGERRLVYLDGSPRPELAALRRLLGRLQEVKVSLAVRKAAATWWQELPEPRKLSDAAGVEGFDEAAAYVLGDLSAEALTARARGTIARRVGAGDAALLALGGPRASDLPDEVQQLLPAPIGSHQARAVFIAAPAGGPPLDLDAALWQGLPALAAVNGLGSLRAGSRIVLRSTDGGPLLCLREDALVRSAVLATDTTYRWLLSSAASDRSRAAHGDLWLKLVAWLLAPRPPRAVTLFADRLTALAGDPIMVTAEVRQGVDAVRLDLLQGEEVLGSWPMEGAGPGRRRARVPSFSPGRYLLRAQATSAGRRAGEDRLEIEVAATSREWRWPSPELPMLRAIAEATGGRLVEWEELRQVAQWLPGEERSVSKPRRLDPARGLGMGLVVLALLASDWLLRRRWGMV